MAKRRFELVEIEAASEALFHPQSFLLNYQEGLLLSLLNKGLLTKWQFDQCLEELQKQAVSD